MKKQKKNNRPKKRKEKKKNNRSKKREKIKKENEKMIKINNIGVF